MTAKSAILALLVVMTLGLGGYVAYDLKKGNGSKLFGPKAEQKSNWKWDDNWDGKNPQPQPKEEDRINKPIPPDGIKVKPQSVAGSYAEALKLSGEQGRPVLAFFTADWCGYCKKMKSETMNDQRVLSVMNNYILVYVDTDKDREGVRDFGVSSLPTFVVTNYKKEKLKVDSGFKNADNFASWLNDNNLFTQPKSQAQPEPKQPEEKKDDRRRIIPRRESTPPQPNNPNMPPRNG